MSALSMGIKAIKKMGEEEVLSYYPNSATGRHWWYAIA